MKIEFIDRYTREEFTVLSPIGEGRAGVRVSCLLGWCRRGGSPALVPEEEELGAFQAVAGRQLARGPCGARVWMCWGNELMVRNLQKDWGLEVLTFEGKRICFKMEVNYRVKFHEYIPELSHFILKSDFYNYVYTLL